MASIPSDNARPAAAPEPRVRILLLESSGALSPRLLDVLHAPPALKLFDVRAVSTLREAFRFVEREPADLVVVEVDPDDAAAPLDRLKEVTAERPVIALLDGRTPAAAPEALKRGVHDVLFDTQIHSDTLPAFLLRAVERHAAHRAVRESEERFRLMIENSSDVITVVDSAGTITYAGPSAARILAYPDADLIGKNALDFLHRDDRRPFLDHFEKAFSSEGELSPISFRFRHRDGRWIHMEGKGRIVRESSGRKICILNSHDVTHRVELERHLRTQSMRDELTGLHNRRSFVAVFDQQLKLAERAKKRAVELLFIDLDEFKWINDHLGHKEGDRVLIAAAKILSQTFRQADLVARLGGDEFVVFLTDDGEDADATVRRLKERLFAAVDEWNRAEARPYTLSMSVGVVHHELGRRVSVEQLLSRADALMYEHKRERKKARAL